MIKIACVALGGAVGAVLRYALNLALPPDAHSLPTATILANVLGCLAIGLLTGLFAGPLAEREALRALLVVGLLGAFTTFSTYGLETIALGQNGRFGLAAANLVLSNAAGLTAVWAGQRLALRFA